MARAYDKLVIGGVFQEQGDYYVRYRSRYESLVTTYAALGGGGPFDVLEVGGGQHALLAQALFADRATVLAEPTTDHGPWAGHPVRQADRWASRVVRDAPGAAL